MGVPRYYCARTMFVNTYENIIEVLIRQHCDGFINRLHCSDNRIIRDVANLYFFEMSKFFARLTMNTEIVIIQIKPCLAFSLIFEV